ncbi:zinc-binding dehydrogenase [Kitasatospora sp. NPDC088134]|uniref:zinc-binding dehydrogenase n=1 Tax=Kitasatospora sp. NPDC088134 TaxID=3364071 RepID=UPI0038161320
MRAVYAQAPCPQDPLAALRVGERPDPGPPPAGWTVLTVAAAALNHRDLFTLRGTNIDDACFPMILGVDAAGFDAAGRPVVLYGLLPGRAEAGDETVASERSVMGQVHQGTCAAQVCVPTENLLPVPDGMPLTEAACVFGAWASAYHMLFTRGGARPGHRVLVQGGAGGLASGLITLARAAGLRVLATARTEDKRRYALEIGAHEVLAPGAALSEPVDLVVDSVGRATWAHSLRSVRRGGTVVVGGVTTGGYPPAHLSRIFYEEITVAGAMAATRAEFAATLAFMQQSGIRPRLDRVVPFAQAPTALADLLAGRVRGKLVLTPD